MHTAFALWAGPAASGWRARPRPGSCHVRSIPRPPGGREAGSSYGGHVARRARDLADGTSIIRDGDRSVEGAVGDDGGPVAGAVGDGGGPVAGAVGDGGVSVGDGGGLAGGAIGDGDGDESVGGTGADGGDGRAWWRVGIRPVLAWALVAPLVLWLVVRATGLGAGTTIETFIVFTPYAALASVATLAAVAILRVRPAALAAGVCCAGYGLVLAPLFVAADGPSPAPTATASS